MFTIRTEVIEDGTKIRATCENRSQTTRYAHTQSAERNHGKVAGMLLNKMTTREQQSKIRHPSGARRVREVVVRDHLGAVKDGRDFYIDV